MADEAARVSPSSLAMADLDSVADEKVHAARESVGLYVEAASTATKAAVVAETAATQFEARAALLLQHLATDNLTDLVGEGREKYRAGADKAADWAGHCAVESEKAEKNAVWAIGQAATASVAAGEARRRLADKPDEEGEIDESEWAKVASKKKRKTLL